MAQTMVIQMSRPSYGATQPWGFRLQGGLDFATPLTVLKVWLNIYLIDLFKQLFLNFKKVNGGSLAETAGLKAGDTILRVNEIDVSRLRHQEALDAIASSGNQFQLLIGRYVNKRILSLKIHRFRLLGSKSVSGAGKARSSYFQLSSSRNIHSAFCSFFFCSPKRNYINYSNVFFPCSFYL